MTVAALEVWNTEPMHLETARLRLREMTVDDLPDLRAILQDEQTMTAYEGAFDETMTQAWLERMLGRYRDDGFGMWAVELREKLFRRRFG